MTLRALLADLLALGRAGPPTAAAILAHVRPAATRVATAGPQLQTPAWTSRCGGADDTYVDLAGDVAGLHLWEDSRGWGAYAELAVVRGTKEDVEAVAGPSTPMPRNPGDFRSGDKVAAYVDQGGRTVRVFAELVKRGPDVARVTVHFQR